MTDIVNIYVGFDSKEVVAHHVLSQSILEKSSVPVRITPIYLHNVANIFTRERNALQSTEFSFSRFLTPYLSQYEGWSLFMVLLRPCSISRIDGRSFTSTTAFWSPACRVARTSSYRLVR